jgi:hypothetical protein
VSTASKTLTFSVWVKGTALETMSLEVTNAVDSGSTIQHTLSGAWDRISVTNTFTSTVANARLHIRTATGDTATSFFAWGAQVEELPFTTSYIKTTAASATRTADVVSCAGLNNINLLSDVNSVSMTTSALGVSNGSQLIVAAVADDNFNRSLALRQSSATLVTNYVSGNTIVGSTSNYTTSLNLVSTFDQAETILYGNGVVSRADAITYTDTANKASTIVFGSSSSYIHIRDFRVYDFALNADQAMYLSGV